MSHRQNLSAVTTTSYWNCQNFMKNSRKGVWPGLNIQKVR